MSETPEPSIQPAPVAAAPPYPPLPPSQWAKPPRLFTAAAWVVIVAGILFILSTVFFSGALILGASHRCFERHHGMMFGPGPDGPWNGPWGPGPGPWAPGPGGPHPPPR